MSAVTYVINQFDTVLIDGSGADFWLRDVPLPDNDDELDIRAMVASGDYFETLAARLEQIAATLPIHKAEQHQLQDAVTQLLYLQRNYAVTKKLRPTVR